MGGGHIIRFGLFRQIEHHQGDETGRRLQDAVLVGDCVGASNDRRHEVRHDDAAREVTGGFGGDGGQDRAVAEMQVPVVGAGDGEGGHERSLMLGAV